MEHTTQIELENLKNLYLAEAGVIKPEDVRQLTIEDALVDTGATGLCLPLIYCTSRFCDKLLH